jgi:hypothetical protein
MFRSLTRTLFVSGAVAAATAFYRSETGQKLQRELKRAIDDAFRRMGGAPTRTDTNGVEVEALDRMTSEGGVPTV